MLTALEMSMQTAAAQGAGDATQTTQTLGEFLSAGGPLMYVIGFFSIVAMACAMERYMRLSRRTVCPKAIDEAVELVKNGRIDEAHVLAEKSRSAGGRILAAGIRRRGFTVDEVERTMQDQGQKEIERMRGKVRTVSLVANLSPLLGLLGTVIGIAEAFHRVVKTGMGKPENLAEGIEVALTTTIAGLCVAIPALVVAAHLNARVRRIALYTDEKISPVVEHLAVQPREESHAA